MNGLLARPGFALPSPDPEDEQGSLRPGIVHRIDKDTSGLLVVAKDDRTREGLKAQLAQHTVERAYLALTVGTPAAGVNQESARTRSEITTAFHVACQRRQSSDHPRARAGALGRRSRLRSSSAGSRPGRTHQIRVHLSEQSKTPLLSDAVYGARASMAKDIAEIAAALGRQALHAGVLGFVHPISNESLRFELPPPTDFARALAALRALS